MPALIQCGFEKQTAQYMEPKNTPEINEILILSSLRTPHHHNHVMLANLKEGAGPLKLKPKGDIVCQNFQPSLCSAFTTILSKLVVNLSFSTPCNTLSNLRGA